MAIPTVTSVSPASGSTKGGNLVRIYGTNFRLPPTPPATGYLGGPQPRTVKVSFEGVVSDWAYAALATMIQAKVPEWRGPYGSTFPVRLDIRVANLDGAGAEIPGEVATLLDGYAFARPSFAAECYFMRVLRELVKLMRRHMNTNVHMTVDRDYDANPADVQRLVASAPVFHLVGPTLESNRIESVPREEYADAPSEAEAFMLRKPAVVCDVGFTVNAYAHNQRQLFAMGQALLLFHRDVFKLRVERDPANPSLGFVEYDFHLPWAGMPDFDTAPSAGGLYSFSASCVIKGVQIDEEAGTVVERGWRIFAGTQDPTLDVQSM